MSVCTLLWLGQIIAVGRGGPGGARHTHSAVLVPFCWEPGECGRTKPRDAQECAGMFRGAQGEGKINLFRWGKRMNSGFCSVSLSQRACGSTGAVSGLIFMYIMGLCFTPSSLSTQIQHLAMLSFVLVCGLSIFFFIYFFFFDTGSGRKRRLWSCDSCGW